MDLQEWEILPDDGFLEIHDDGGKQIFSRKFVSDPKNVFDMNYFTCSSQNCNEFVESVPPRQLLHVPIQLKSGTDQDPDHEVVKEVTSVQIKAPGSFQGGDQDQISQVFFKKMKENEFVDMKMDSPKSINNKGVIHQVNSIKDEGLESENDSEIVIKKTKGSDESWEEKPGDLKIWKWRLSGIGAICSIGVAAATVCIIFLGGRQKNKHHHHHHHHQESQKLQFHPYSDDNKMMNQGKWNEALSAASRAHITVGGYYDAY